MVFKRPLDRQNTPGGHLLRLERAILTNKSIIIIHLLCEKSGIS